MKRYYLLFALLFRAKFFWKKPKQCDFVIYDRLSLVFLKYDFDISKFFILDTRKESFNIPILLKTIIIYNFNWSPEKYYNWVIKVVNPKIIITLIDNDIKFWNIKKNFKNLTTISIQNGRRSNFIDIYSKLDDTKLNKFFIDYMFVQNESIGKKVSSYIKGKVIPIGSVYNNRIPIESEKVNNNILFISEWVSTGNKKIFTDEYRYPEKIIIPFLYKFAKSNGLKLSILGRPYRNSPNIKKQKLEYQFYYNIIKSKDWDHIFPNSETGQSYKLIDQSKIIVGITSTLIYESIARGKPTAVFSSRGQKLNGNTGFKFGWPSDLPDNGPFWTNLNDVNEFTRILNYLKNIDSKEWNEVSRPYLSYCMKYDKYNLSFLNQMKKLNVPLAKEF